MEGDLFPGLSNGNQVDGKVLQTFQKSFVQVQDILDQNRLLINEINQNHESKIPDNLTRNVGLIKELNNNIRRVVDLYADLSSNFTRSMEPSSEGESSGILKSNGKANSKRIRSGFRKDQKKDATLGCLGEDMTTLRGRKVINRAGAQGPSDSLRSGAGRTLLILYY
ncbi:hypothetical protein NC653_008460 [Populus alba x Populus x berolinensis]|uniref:Protein EARLY FLOWERING 4 domain-containing protein n=2 Tax=Populus TaxID=3689 RepID=A0A4U5QW78_POPAL|nr:hypothetical protein NC653_008460 [Populus alba x Populus x berolinensis]TKS15394.1 hypothetical protein D5086_0000034310 [Populus alba]